jgi:hypothetical protein
MNTFLQEMAGDARAPDVVRTFALRLARRCLLEQLCPADHPVLDTERHLVEMARSKLQEHLIVAYGPERFETAVVALKAEILEIAERKTFNQIDDDALCHAVIDAIRREDFDSLVPVLN